MVQATLLNAVPFVDWFEEGVKSSSQTDQWEIKGVKSDDEGRYVGKVVVVIVCRVCG